MPCKLNSCLAVGNESTAQEAVADYLGLGCIPRLNASQGSVLEVLASSSLRLPRGLLQRFEADTGWRVRVTSWDEASGSLPPLASVSDGSSGWAGAAGAGGNRRAAIEQAGTSATNTSQSVESRPDWVQALALSYDAWILDSQLLAGMGRYGALAAPAKLLQDPATFMELQRSSQPQARLYGTSYRYTAAALPLGSNSLVLYGHDAALLRLHGNGILRQRLGLQLAVDGSLVLPPAWSWEQLVDAVAAVNGTDFDGDGAIEYGICLEAAPGCMAPALLQAVAASYLQTHGSGDGVLLDPETLAWRLQSAGFRTALWTLQRLLAYAPLSSTGGGGGGGSGGGSDTAACRRLSRGFAEGTCAFTIHGLQHLKASYVWPRADPAATAAARVMLLPGSTFVSPRGASSLVACTAASCPLSVPLSGGGVERSSMLGLPWRVSAWASGAAGDGTPTVNVAPLVYGNPVGAVSAATPVTYGSAAARLLASLASAEAQAELAADPESGVIPFRRVVNLTSGSQSARRPSQRQLEEHAAVQARLWGHPNAAPALRLPGAEQAWPLFDAALSALQRGGDPYASTQPNRPYADDDWQAPREPSPAVSAVVEALAAELPAALEVALPSAAALAAEYRASVAYRQPLLTSRFEEPAGPPPIRTALVAGLAVGLSLGLLALMVSTALYARKSLRRLRRTASQDDDSSNQRSTATYVVLDIQGLSDECVSDTVREQALRHCHDVIKQLARRYNGTLVTLPESEMRHARRLPRTRPSAALEAAVRAELAAAVAPSADGRQPGWPRGSAGSAAAGGAMAGKATTPGGFVDGDAGGAGGAGGAESGAAAGCRNTFWTYDSEYMSLNSRDLDAVPSQSGPSPSAALGLGLDGSTMLPPLPLAAMQMGSNHQDQMGSNNEISLAAGAARGAQAPPGSVSAGGAAPNVQVAQDANEGSSMRLPTVAGYVSPPHSPHGWDKPVGCDAAAGVGAVANLESPFTLTGRTTQLSAGPVSTEPTATTSSTLATTYSGGRAVSKSGGGGGPGADGDGPSFRGLGAQPRTSHGGGGGVAGAAAGAGGGSERLLRGAAAPVGSKAVHVSLFTGGGGGGGGGAPSPPLAAAGAADPGGGAATAVVAPPQPGLPPPSLQPPPPPPSALPPRHQSLPAMTSSSPALRTYSPETSQLLLELENAIGHHAGLLPTLPEGAVAGLGGAGAVTRVLNGMQNGLAMLTNCRWPSEILQLPACRPVAVRPRSAADGGSEHPAGEVAGAAAREGRFDTGGGRAGTPGTSGAMHPGNESSGGAVVASAQSSFIVTSNSPFSAAGAVDRMKSLISGGVKGRSGRLMRVGMNSPRVGSPIVGSGHGAVPDRSAPSVSRFAAAAAAAAQFGGGGSGGGAASGPLGVGVLPGAGSTLGGLAGGSLPMPPPLFATQSAAPYISATPGAGFGFRAGSHAGSHDPWAAGVTASSACSRDGSVSTWCPPPFVSQGVGMGMGLGSGMQAGSSSAALHLQVTSGSSSAAAISRRPSGGDLLRGAGVGLPGQRSPLGGPSRILTPDGAAAPAAGTGAAAIGSSGNTGGSSGSVLRGHVGMVIPRPMHAAAPRGCRSALPPSWRPPLAVDCSA
ncbi:hypothetical protein GPECTOR_31g359 [Gonium pectorale]|uniref:Uncharacterized protein n=1 Tax=Gonium pectorale TaxID=33097 RepID=A0A150GDU1_GONPE|nr:hypothetical protein GPECTOR_31g359 [Gonium pectorale]|eukprot:KXZ47996.1 hypothetical protein GPECTOR_31g359 [Gonium pectorale]